MLMDIDYFDDICLKMNIIISKKRLLLRLRGMTGISFERK